MKLGQQVLNKISDLLVEIDRPRSPNKKPKHHEEIKEPILIAAGERKPKHKTNHFAPQLDNYQNKKLKAIECSKQNIKKQISQLNSFKVDNKHSIFLNARNDQRPIYQRTADIIRNKELLIEKKRTEINLERDRRQLIEEENGYLDSQNFNYRIQKSKSAKKFASKQEIDEIMKRRTQREKECKQKANAQKMNHLKEKLLSNKEKPRLSKNTENLWERRKNKLDLSDNVFQRFETYVLNHRRNQQQLIKNFTETETPFKPEISKNTDEILNRSLSKTTMKNLMNHPKSCRNLNNETNKKSMYLKTNFFLTSKKPNLSSTYQKSNISLTPKRF